MPETLWLIAGGLAVGGSLGLLGAGGASLAVPILLLAGVGAKPAIATSLLVVATTAVVAAAGHARAHNVDARTALYFAPATALGGFAGGRAAGFVAPDTLLLCFVALMLGAAVAMLRPGVPAARGMRSRPAVLAVTGAAIGVITGLVGAGGGFLFVPALALLAGLTMQRAVGTSLVVIAANALAALAGQLQHVALDLGVAVPLTSGALAGALAGARFGRRTREDRLRRAFGVLLLGVAAWILWRESLVPLPWAH